MSPVHAVNLVANSGNTSYRHYSDVIMGTKASQITAVSIVSQPFVEAQIKENIKALRASVALARGIHRWPVNSTPKGPVTRKMFQFDSVIMGWEYWRPWLISHWQLYLHVFLKLYWDGCQWFLVNIGSGNGVVPSGNRPMIWAIVGQCLCCCMASDITTGNDLNTKINECSSSSQNTNNISYFLHDIMRLKLMITKLNLLTSTYSLCLVSGSNATFECRLNYGSCNAGGKWYLMH